MAPSTASSGAPSDDTGSFDIWATYQSILNDEKVCHTASHWRLRKDAPTAQISTPLAAILALTELIRRSHGILPEYHIAFLVTLSVSGDHV